MAEHWEKYARRWQPGTTASPQILPDVRVEHPGDEWTASAHKELGGHAYGLTREAVANFDEFIAEHLLDSYLPARSTEGLEIGSGGSRLTALLLPRTETLHAAEPSKAMLRHLERRFAGTDSLRLYHTDGMTLPSLRPASLDYVFAFDVFIHFEPRLVYWYLRQIRDLLKPGGTSIITYANVLTSIGWHKFESSLEENLQRRFDPVAFGVMCPQLMARFLQALRMEVIFTDLGLIPRDAIAVFRKPLDRYAVIDKGVAMETSEWPSSAKGSTQQRPEAGFC
jgi:SAM-dependent methyltransferase